MPVDLPPVDLWTPSAPAIIRPAEHSLLMPGAFRPMTRAERRATIADLLRTGRITRDQVPSLISALILAPQVGWKTGGFGFELFTSSGTWVNPGGVTAVEVLLIAGGGGGSGYNSGNATQRGGGGGLGVSTDFAVAGNVTVTIGTAGNGCQGGGGYGSGSDGNTSTFSTMSCTGGKGGIGPGGWDNPAPDDGVSTGADHNSVADDVVAQILNLSQAAQDVITQLTTQSVTERPNDANDTYNLAEVYTEGGTWVPGIGGQYGLYNNPDSAGGGEGGACWVFWGG